MQKRITLRNIAAEANVHVTTVSLALRNNPRIPEATRNRIKALAEKMGYTPDPVLSALMVYRQSAKPAHERTPIAYLTGGPSRTSWKKQSSLAAIFDGANRWAQSHGYHLIHFWIPEEGVSLARWNQIFAAQGIEAILVGPWMRGRAHLRLDWSRFYCVKIGYALIYPSAHTVENNHYQCMQLCMRQLRKKGYRRIGYANAGMDNERLDHLYEAALMVQQQKFSQSSIIPPHTPRDWNQDLFVAWYERYKPDVVITSDQRVYGWLEQMGLSIPDDVGYANLDAQEPEQSTSGICQAHEEVGAAAVDLLIGLIQRNERGLPKSPHLMLIKGGWVDGRTIRHGAPQK